MRSAFSRSTCSKLRRVPWCRGAAVRRRWKSRLSAAGLEFRLQPALRLKSQHGKPSRVSGAQLLEVWKLKVSLMRGVILQPDHVRVVWTRHVEWQGHDDRRHGAGIPPLMNRRMTVGKGQGPRAIVIACGVVHETRGCRVGIAVHLDRKIRVIRHYCLRRTCAKPGEVVWCCWRTRCPGPALLLCLTRAAAARPESR